MKTIFVMVCSLGMFAADALCAPPGPTPISRVSDSGGAHSRKGRTQANLTDVNAQDKIARERLLKRLRELFEQSRSQD